MCVYAYIDIHIHRDRGRGSSGFRFKTYTVCSKALRKPFVPKATLFKAFGGYSEPRVRLWSLFRGLVPKLQ